jgi:hypothetical protein
MTDAAKSAELVRQIEETKRTKERLIDELAIVEAKLSEQERDLKVCIRLEEAAKGPRVDEADKKIVRDWFAIFDSTKHEEIYGSYTQYLYKISCKRECWFRAEPIPTASMSYESSDRTVSITYCINPKVHDKLGRSQEQIDAFARAGVTVTVSSRQVCRMFQ